MLTFAAVPRVHAADVEVAAPSAKAAPLRWFHAGHGLPNESEVLFYALLVVQRAQTASDAKQWAQELLVHYERINASNTWPPADVAGLHWQGSRAPPLLKLLYDAYNAMWVENDLTKIAKAMLCFQGPGRFVKGDLRASHLRTYKDANVQGPPQGPKKRTKARYLSAAVVEVARLVQRETSTLRQLLKMETPIEEVVTVSMELELVSQRACHCPAGIAVRNAVVAHGLEREARKDLRCAPQGDVESERYQS